MIGAAKVATACSFLLAGCAEQLRSHFCSADRPRTHTHFCNTQTGQAVV
jgi:hypothetical protein